MTAVERSAVTDATGSMHGFPAALTSFVGRAGVVDEIVGQLGQCRLVTVTGPGGAGKTRLAGEVARQVAGRFADGVWLAELAAVRDPAQVAAAVAAALGIRELPAVAAALCLPEWDQLSDAELLEQIPDFGRAVLVATGLLAEDFSADDLRQAIPRLKDAFRGQGFLPAQAAVSILEGVRSGAWRILVGEDAKMLDEQVRANPEAPFNYENYPEMYGPLIARAQESD